MSHIEKINMLKQGQSVLVVGMGDSMRGLVESGATVQIDPIGSTDEIRVGDIVFCSIHGKKYLHLVTAIHDGRYEISNNHGYVNGWVSREEIYGKLRQE